MLAERLVTKAKKGGLSREREIRTWLLPSQTSRVFQIASDLKERRGGYTIITRTRYRSHDGAPMAILEFIKQ